MQFPSAVSGPQVLRHTLIQCASSECFLSVPEPKPETNATLREYGDQHFKHNTRRRTYDKFKLRTTPERQHHLISTYGETTERNHKTKHFSKCTSTTVNHRSRKSMTNNTSTVKEKNTSELATLAETTAYRKRATYLEGASHLSRGSSIDARRPLHAFHGLI